MNKTPSWPEYLRRVTDGRTATVISKQTGIGLSTITRWMNGQTTPSSAKLSELARVYPFPLDEAMRVLSTYEPPRAITQTTLNGVTLRVAADVTRGEILRYFSDLELAEEFVRRIEQNDAIEDSRPLPTNTRPNVGDLTEDDYAVTPNGPQGDFDLAARRRPKKANQPHAE